MSPIPSTEATPPPPTEAPAYLVWSIDKGGFHNRRQHGYTQHVADARYFTRAEAEEAVRRSGEDNYPNPSRAVMIPAPNGNRYLSSDTRVVLDLAADALAQCLILGPAGAEGLAHAFRLAPEAHTWHDRAAALRLMAMACAEEAARADYLGARRDEDDAKRAETPAGAS